jgi:hypothetical protein
MNEVVERDVFQGSTTGWSGEHRRTNVCAVSREHAFCKIFSGERDVANRAGKRKDAYRSEARLAAKVTVEDETNGTVDETYGGLDEIEGGVPGLVEGTRGKTAKTQKGTTGSSLPVFYPKNSQTRTSVQVAI